MDKELFKKLIDEKPLTAEEALELDEALESDACEQVAHMVAAQHDDAPSLEWRSELNEKLSSETRKGRKAWFWGVGAAVSTGAAATLMFLAMFNAPISEGPQGGNVADNTAAQTDTLEDLLIEEHQQAMNQEQLGLYVSFEDGSGF